MPKGLTRDAFIYALLNGSSRYDSYPERVSEMLHRCFVRSMYVVRGTLSIDEAVVSLSGPLRFIDITEEGVWND
jgi:hypothetical protein